MIKLFAEYLKSDEVREMFNVPVFFTEKEKIYKIDQNGWREIFSCNHEEADYSLVLHASLYDTPCVVRSKDTDVLVLLEFGYNRMKPSCNWFMQYENTADTYADNNTINMYLGANIVSCLPHYHVLSGCDTTSFFYNCGKIPTLKKIQKNPSCVKLIEDLGTEVVLSEDSIGAIMKFIQPVMYSGKDNESYVETSVCLYRQQATKSSLTLPSIQIHACKLSKELIIRISCVRGVHKRILIPFI